MTLMDKVIAAVSPQESDEARAQARSRARAAAGSSGWLAMILDHHLEIEDAFEAVTSASSAASRRAAQKLLGTLLTGHSIAEEAAIYPALAGTDQKSHAEEGYKEQSEAKMEMAALEGLDPMSQPFLDKLEQIRDAVAHHVYEEEGTWFPALREQADPPLQARMTRRYREEFMRYMGQEAAVA